ncbi:putative transcription factor bHLH family [Lupinus albus]|uniref:Putative transcription factor bHLH family n=1 Tax=Lupinus albus TaxID=3870 RepID=A0A6A4QBR7_LUPAL|nr:putative transcription factor bHLH family [Lupinus albus]
MEAKQEFEVDHHLNTTTTTTGTSFSQLLLGNNDTEDENALGVGVVQNYYSINNNNNNLIDFSPVFPIHIAPQMLCFGNCENKGLPETNALTPQKSVTTNSSDSSSASSCNQTTINSLSKPNLKSLQKKRQEPVTKVGVGSQRPPKKTKADTPTSTGHAKRKEKLGERIAALQQLVSPFGKTDTASVLHEAMGYIKFLQDQVQVLCSPYLQRLPSKHHQIGNGDNDGEEELTKDMRSMGLCLIPMECTVHLASSNGADFWSPAAICNNISPSTTMH